MTFQSDQMPRTFPKVQFGRALQQVAKMHSLVERREFYGQIITPDVVPFVASAVVAGFGETSGVKLPVVERCLSELVGRRCEFPLLDWLFRRLTANVDDLRRGSPVFFSATGNIPERTWTAVEFREIYQQGSVLTLDCLVVWGPLIGTRVLKAVDVNQPSIYTLLYKVIGRRNLGDPRELVQLRFWAELAARQGVVGFRRYDTDSQLDAYNAKMLKRRRETCPVGYTWPCVRCPIGYDHCARACRAVTVSTQVIQDASGKGSGTGCGVQDGKRVHDLDESRA